jgi:hypothetical protein
MSDFRLYALDEDFDLIDGPLPDSMEFKFGDQLDRARAVLKGRSRNQMRYGLESLDWMLRKGGDMLMKEALKSSTEKGVFIDRVKALHALMNSGEVEIDNQTSLPGASWADYFALLTLAYVAEVLHMVKSPSDRLDNFYLEFGLDPSKYKIRDKVITEWAIEAMDAVSLAERLQSEAELLHDIGDSGKVICEHMRGLGRKGGKTKPKEFGQLRSKCLQLYSERYLHLSNRGAARRICKELTNDERQIFTTDLPQETIEYWLGKFKRGQADL